MPVAYILIGIGVLLVVYFVATYNGLVVLKTRIQEAFSGILRRFPRKPPSASTLRNSGSASK